MTQTVHAWEEELKARAYAGDKHIVSSWTFEYDTGEDGCMPAGWYAIGCDQYGAAITFPVRHEYGPFPTLAEAQTATNKTQEVAP